MSSALWLMQTKLIKRFEERNTCGCSRRFLNHMMQFTSLASHSNSEFNFWGDSTSRCGSEIVTGHHWMGPTRPTRKSKQPGSYQQKIPVQNGICWNRMLSNHLNIYLHIQITIESLVPLVKQHVLQIYKCTFCSCLAMLSNESDSRKFLAPTKSRPLSSSSSRALKQQERSSSNRRTPWNCCNSEEQEPFKCLLSTSYCSTVHNN